MSFSRRNCERHLHLTEPWRPWARGEPEDLWPPPASIDTGPQYDRVTMPTHHPISHVRSRVGVRPSQRLAARGALVANGASLLLLLLLVVGQPVFALSVLAVSLAFLATSVVALTTAGPLRAVFALASVVLVLLDGALMVFWATSRGAGAWIGPVALALLAAGFALDRYALKLTAAPEPGDPAPRRRARARRHSVLFVNPHSGGGKAEEFDLIARAREMGVRTVVLEKGDDLVSLARRAADDGARVLGMAGGDGSLGCVMGVAIDHDLPFVCIPAGTRNHFALDLGLDRRDPSLALAAFTDGEERRVDYATVNDRVFVNNVALGLYAAIVDQEGYRDAKLQTALELIPQASDGLPFFDLEYEVPEAGPQTTATLLLVSNNPYELAGGSIQRARLDRGELGVISLQAEGVRDLLGATLLAAAGRPDASRALWRWETEELTVGSPHPQIVAGVDGETITFDAPLRLAIHPAGARVLVPPGSLVGLAEQRVGGGARFAGLLEVAFDLPAGRD
jgi:diacylglycerol kinase family enzyme